MLSLWHQDLLGNGELQQVPHFRDLRVSGGGPRISPPAPSQLPRAELDPAPHRRRPLQKTRREAPSPAAAHPLRYLLLMRYFHDSF